MEIEYLSNRRIGSRVEAVDAIVYYKPLINSELERANRQELKTRIFGEKLRQLTRLFAERKAKFQPDMDAIEGKIDKLSGLVYSFSDSSMDCAELLGINISASGLRMRIRRPFEVGDRFEMIIVFLSRVDLLDCQCEVVRVTPFPDDSGELYEVAVKFVVIDDEDRYKIIRYVRVTINAGPT